MQSKEQKLIDVMYEVGAQIHDNPWFKGKSNEEVMNWISEQLNKSGFKVEKMGALWGVLVDD